MDQWYYTFSGTQQGPVTLEQITQLLQTGQLPPDTLVWREGMPNWLPANTVPEMGIANTAPVLGYGMGESVYQTARSGLNYAGFWLRFGGAFIDGLVLLIPNGIVSVGTTFAIAQTMGNGQDAQIMTLFLRGGMGMLVAWPYFALMHSSKSQASLGQMACGIKVTDDQGNRITFARATGRHFASLLSQIICYIGYLMMLWSDKKQTLHDQLAKTLVVYK